MSKAIAGKNKTTLNSGLHLSIPVKLSSFGAEFPDDLSKEDYGIIGVALAQLDKALPCWIGDYLNSYEAHYGETYAQAQVYFHREPGTLANYKSVYKRIESSLRTENLYHSHYEVIAFAVKDSEQRKHWIDECSKHGWTVTKLKDELLLAGIRKQKFIEPVKLCDDCGHPATVTVMLCGECADARR